MCNTRDLYQYDMTSRQLFTAKKRYARAPSQENKVDLYHAIRHNDATRRGVEILREKLEQHGKSSYILDRLRRAESKMKNRGCNGDCKDPGIFIL